LRFGHANGGLEEAIVAVRNAAGEVVHLGAQSGIRQDRHGEPVTERVAGGADLARR
jgi:hypothetical protein